MTKKTDVQNPIQNTQNDGPGRVIIAATLCIEHYPQSWLNRYSPLKPGTKVVSVEDGEPGTIVRVCSYRRGAWSYVVQTKDGREVWDAGELFVPTRKF